jgi:hypothetical protein
VVVLVVVVAEGAVVEGFVAGFGEGEVEAAALGWGELIAGGVGTLGEPAADMADDLGDAGGRYAEFLGDVFLGLAVDGDAAVDFLGAG